MGLAKSVAVRFPVWGGDFAAVMYGMVRPSWRAWAIAATLSPSEHFIFTEVTEDFLNVSHSSQIVNCQLPLASMQIMMNMLVGPSLFKAAIVALGEAHPRDLSAVDEEAGLELQPTALPPAQLARLQRPTS